MLRGVCGRFVSTMPADQLAQYFGALLPPQQLDPNHNVAPTQNVYGVFESDGIRHLDTFRWGLVPVWADSPKVGNRMINARAETLAQRNSYKRPFARRRCLIPADGFYEWCKVSGVRRSQPMYISRPDGEPFAFAGLWEIWKDRNLVDSDGNPLELHTCTIITGTPNTKMAEIHDRMPVMLPPRTWDQWLDPDNRDTETLSRLLLPAPAGLIRIHPVSTEVNNVRNNGPQLLVEVAPQAGE